MSQQMAGQECHAEACAIQDCLSKNGYQDSKCRDAVRNLYQCCSDMYARLEKQGSKDLEKDRSESCPLPYVVKNRLQAFSKEAEGGGGGSGK